MPNLNLQTIKDAIGSLLGQAKDQGDVDAIDMLKQDHRRVEQLGKDFADAEDNSQKKSIATKILLELTIHAKLEEELVYPLLEKIAGLSPGGDGSNGAAGRAPEEEQTNSAQQSADNEDGEEDEEEKQEIDEAYVEHHMVKLLIAELEHANPGDKQYDARVKVLIEMVKHHVKEEESELLPRLRASGQDMHALGEKLSQRKQQLLKELEKRPRMSGDVKAAPSKAKTKVAPTSKSKSTAKSTASGRKSASGRAKSPAGKGKVAKTAAKATAAKKTGKARASSAKMSGRSSAKTKPQAKASSGAKAKSKPSTARKAAGTRKTTTTAKKSPTSKAKSRKK